MAANIGSGSTKPVPPSTEPALVPYLVLGILGTAIAIAANFATDMRYMRLWWMVAIFTTGLSVAEYLRKKGVKNSRMIIALMVTMITAFAPTLVRLVVGPGCPARCFDFEHGRTQGWGIRTEADVLLGDSVHNVETIDGGGWLDHHSLAVGFTLGGAPRNKAQIKIEGVKFDKEMRASVFVPQDMLQTLRVVGYVLERNSDPNSDRPEWLFYETQPVDLNAGTWNSLHFAKDQFRSPPPYTTWRGVPLLVGFEIHEKDRGPVTGTVYFDNITIR